MNPFFSIIIPIYNVSHFIGSGIGYIIEQSFKNFEVIFIDDGSSDDSGKKCDYLASLYGNIHCFHQDNKGSGPARNLGIQESKGDYIVFFDIDDRIEPDFLQTIYDELISHEGPQVLIFSYDSYDVKYHTLTPVVFDKKLCKSNSDIRNIYVDTLLGINQSNGFVWNKIYNRQFLLDNSLSFPDLLIQQDEVFNLRVYRKAQNLVVSSEILYHYYVYDKGNTRSKYIEDRLKIYRTVKKEFLSLYDYWELDDKRMLAYVYNRYFNAIIHTLNFNNNHKNSPLEKEARDGEMKSIFNDADVQECLLRLNDLGIAPTTGFNRFYYKAIRERNVFKYKILRMLNLKLKYLKRKLELK